MLSCQRFDSIIVDMIVSGENVFLYVQIHKLCLCFLSEINKYFRILTTLFKYSKYIFFLYPYCQ